MHNDTVQRPGNAGATGGATIGATPVQRPVNEGATHTPHPYGVALAFEGEATEHVHRVGHAHPCPPMGWGGCDVLSSHSNCFDASASIDEGEIAVGRMVPMPRLRLGGGFGGRGFPLALTGRGVAA